MQTSNDLTNQYIITDDTEQTLPEVDSTTLKTARKQIDQSISDALGNAVLRIPFGEIQQFLQETSQSSNTLAVWLDEVYKTPNASSISLTRTYPNIESIIEQPESYQLDPRGEIPLDDQISEITQALTQQGKTSISLIDDGIFSGSTLKYIMQELQNKNITISAIRTFLNFSGETTLNNIPIVAQGVGAPLDWLDERDLIGGAKLGGATVKRPTENRRGIPYFWTPEMLTKKASIPQKEAPKVRNTIIQANIDLQEALGSPDLQTYPRLAFLMQKKYGGFKADTPLIDIYNKMINQSI